MLQRRFLPGCILNAGAVTSKQQRADPPAVRLGILGRKIAENTGTGEILTVGIEADVLLGLFRVDGQREYGRFFGNEGFDRRNGQRKQLIQKG